MASMFSVRDAWYCRLQRADLPHDVFAVTAVVGEPDRGRVDRVQRGDHAVELVVHPSALGG